jgi:hypothetical protein
MTKTESDYFFFHPPKSEYFFQQNWESEYLLGKKKQNPPFKLNGRSLSRTDSCKIMIFIFMGATNLWNSGIEDLKSCIIQQHHSVLVSLSLHQITK